MIEVSEPLDLPQKGRFRGGRGLVFRQHLDGDNSPHHRVLRLEDPPHSALPHLVEDAVLVERKLAAAHEHLASLKLRQQAATHQHVSQCLVPVISSVRPFAEHRPGLRFGGVDLCRVEQTAGERRFAETAAWREVGGAAIGGIGMRSRRHGFEAGGVVPESFPGTEFTPRKDVVPGGRLGRLQANETAA